MAVIKKHQNTTDLVAQHYGTMESLFDMAVANDISITEDVQPGDEITTAPVEKNVTNYYTQTGLDIASAPLEPDVNYPKPNGGIGFMKITNPDLPQSDDFIAS